MYSSVSLKRSDVGWIKTGGSNGARGAITASTYLLPLVDVCLASFVLSYLDYPRFHLLFTFPSSSDNSVDTLKSKQQIMSKDQNHNDDLGRLKLR